MRGLAGKFISGAALLLLLMVKLIYNVPRDEEARQTYFEALL